MAEYMIRKDSDIDLIQIVKKSGGEYSYWNNRLRVWKENSWTAQDVFTGWSDELYLPITEKEVDEIVAKYPKAG